MKMIVGLGNPGKQYDKTRHNVGFAVVDNLCRINGFRCEKSKFGALYCECALGGQKFLVVKPQGYMNLSGQPVASLKGYFKVENKDIVVVCDDMDIDPGKVRLRVSGGHGGHNGLRSILQALGGDDFCRLRIGIGRSKHKNEDPSDYVLGRFSEPEMEDVEKALVMGVSILECCVKENIEVCMNRYN